MACHNGSAWFQIINSKFLSRCLALTGCGIQASLLSHDTCCWPPFSLSDWELQLQLEQINRVFFWKDCTNNNGWYTNHWGLLFCCLYSPLCVWACEGGCVFGHNGLFWNAFLLQVWLMIISIFFVIHNINAILVF